MKTMTMKFCRLIKLKLLLINLFLIFSLFSVAQKKGFNSGILIGVVPSQVDGDTYSGYHKVGIQTGLFSEFAFNEKISLFVEIKYINKGAKYVSKNNLMYYKSSLHYVEIPFSLQYSYKNKYLFNAGLAFAYLVFYTENFGAGNVIVAPFFKKLEFSGFLGIGYKLSDKLIFINRFGYSILPIRDYALPSIRRFDNGWNNNIIMLDLFYKFL